MAGKRTPATAGHGSESTEPNVKRLRIAGDDEQNTSKTSSSPVFDTSAVLSNTLRSAAEPGRNNRMSSVPARDLDSASESEASSIVSDTSEEDEDATSEDEEENEDAIDMSRLDHLPREVRPPPIDEGLTGHGSNANAGRLLADAKGLKSRLATFLPQLEQANDEIAQPGKNVNIEDVSDDEEHIEMNLALGVLEQRDQSSTMDSSSDESEGEGVNGQMHNQSSPAARRLLCDEEPDIMRHLLGQTGPRQRPGIAVIHESTLP